MLQDGPEATKMKTTFISGRKAVVIMDKGELGVWLSL